MRKTDKGSPVPHGRTVARYTRPQIVVHWAVVLLIIGQWYTSGAIPRTHNPLLPASEKDLFLHAVHNYTGLLIGLLMVTRVWFRWSRPRSEISLKWPERLSQAVQYGLYATLLGQAGAGWTAAYLWTPAGRIHVLFWNVTLVLLSLHIAAAIYHAVHRDGIVSRMIAWPR